jgi:hypothetical protein
MSTLPVTCDLLPPFALRVHFPHALVERDFHDSFHGSVTLPLSRLSSILSSSKRLSVRRYPCASLPVPYRSASDESLNGKDSRSHSRRAQARVPCPVGWPNSAMSFRSNHPVFPFYGLTDEHLIPDTGISLAFLPACSCPPVPFGRRYLRPFMRAKKPLCSPRCSRGPASLRERRSWHRGALLPGFRRHAGVTLDRAIPRL